MELDFHPLCLWVDHKDVDGSNQAQQGFPFCSGFKFLNEAIFFSKSSNQLKNRLSFPMLSTLLVKRFI